MRALLPVYCRPLGYFIIALALFLPFIFLLWGKVTDANLLFYKECSKLLMMMGALMIIFALTKNENKEIEQVRNKATRNAIFLTVLFIFGGMLYRVAQGDLLSVDSSSFLIFLILNVLCLEFGIKRQLIDYLSGIVDKRSKSSCGALNLLPGSLSNETVNKRHCSFKNRQRIDT
jgi:hypothetical protein